MNHIEELNNPTWYSLTGPHQHFAIGTDNAKHYPLNMLVIAGLKNFSDDDLREMATIIEPEQYLGFFGVAEHNTSEWKTVFADKIVQMVCPERIPIPEHTDTVISLTKYDVPNMIDLIKLTEPGPFEERTIEMGPYLGIRQDNQLVAMAGSRIFTPHYREISAVCTHPDYRGRGYAGLLTSILVNRYFDDDITPFLHADPKNESAIRLYEKLGFIHNPGIGVLVVQRRG